ncbi:prepilin-type N-terminal cleavage/methylation domain-containing protein [Idiomarina abyssalis]|uniref:prepilin-type N-terminal cleavage/methylation domain-containing protein n=1 Tax=Idiomarina abyssalis TaxID=86102 RepID=UPI0006C83F5A|nr:prepilin-type N-terminal cleavage/methylation domain-containing protein [Idiomarina abyssalis]KPD21262.1 Type II secretory pathway, pseudopilin [Idiomarina abyssalis]SFT71634.1 MSHA pilin protein MshA [Idiomarina abyssalis]
MRNQKGFTLIELIIVIVVLGILAVTAAPQFINFSGDARTSTVKGLKGAMQGATQTVYARAAIDDDLDGTSAAPVTVNGVATVNGYPAATQAGIVTAANLDATNVDPATTVTTDWAFFADSGTISIAPGDQVVDPTTAAVGDITDTNCYATYSDAADSNTPPVITIVTTGC